jgi:hypothetical protein
VTPCASLRRDLVARVTSEQRLLLAAALGQGADARAAWAQWRATIDLEDIDGDSLRLLPLLARRLDDLADADPVRQVVRGVYRKAWVQNQLLVRRAATVVDSLAAAEVPSIVLKGASLIRYFGGDWGARPMYDVDILVPTTKIVGALDVVDTLGWKPEQAVTASWVRWRELARAHACGFTAPDDSQLDLHWHVMAGSIGPHADDVFWDRAVPLQVGSLRAQALSDPDLLLHLLVHGGVSGPTTPLVQWVADAVIALRGMDVPAVHERLAEQARAHYALTVVKACLGAIVDLVDDEPAAAVLAAVERTRPVTLERLASGSARYPGGATARVASELARHGGGRTRLPAAVLALARDRLDLDLCRRRTLGLAYGVTGRAQFIARLARAIDGSYARTPVGTPPILSLPIALDFTDAHVLDRYGGPGWGRADEHGSSTKGRESRLVLPIHNPGGAAAVLMVEATARAQPADVEIVLNGRRAARLQIDPSTATYHVSIHLPASSDRHPVELAFRGAGRPFGPRAPRLYISRVELQPAPAGGGTVQPAA